MTQNKQLYKVKIIVFILTDKILRDEFLPDNVFLPLVWKCRESYVCGQWGAWISSEAIVF